MDILAYLKNEAAGKSGISQLVDAFENMCRVPLSDFGIEVEDAEEDDLLLFETGTFPFTGEPLWYFSLTRQYPDGEGEYWQLHLDVRFPPSGKNSELSDTVWSDEFNDFGEFFAALRKSEEYAAAVDDVPAEIDIYLGET